VFGMMRPPALNRSARPLVANLAPKHALPALSKMELEWSSNGRVYLCA
jgi:hypothetical protein